MTSRSTTLLVVAAAGAVVIWAAFAMVSRSITLGELIGLLSIAAFLLTGWAIFSVGGKTQDDDRIEVLERRLRAIRPPVEPDHPGEIVPFKRKGRA